MNVPEFSFRTREEALKRFRSETFDLLIIGGGITGAAVARDAALRGLRVALVEREDFAFGTSSRSSKLIHGGLRYLQNWEFGLVFEALAERALLLRTAPHMVRPLPFYFPVFAGDPHGRGILGLGMWLYDLLTLFRTPGWHRSLSKRKMLEEIPSLREEGLRGGFRYYDASMWDDALAVQTLQSAQAAGAAIASYVEATSPIWQGEKVAGFRVRDREMVGSGEGQEFTVRAGRVISCVGPWTDELGTRISREWPGWLSPSKGVHLIFDLKRLPVPGALVMSHPQDGRIAFVIPRPDFGAGVVIVGTTDGPTPQDPARAGIDPEDVRYLLDLLHRYFPKLDLKASDILSAYVGVRPLMAPTVGGGESLQKVSREHHIALGPGSTVFVAGGKYTTHRKMAEEIVDFTLKTWGSDRPATGVSRTSDAVNPRALPFAVETAQAQAKSEGVILAAELISRYGADGLEIARAPDGTQPDPDGFPKLAGQLLHAMRFEGVLHLEDFYLRRIPLYAARADHGLPWAEQLSRVWAEERGVSEDERRAELDRLRDELVLRSRWREKLKFN